MGNREQGAAGDRLAQVRAALARAEADAERPAGSVTLVAVSKTVPAQGIVPVLQAGQRVFGENYVQEAKAKWPDLRAAFPDVELHLVGPLQSNKAAEAVALFDAIHSLDRESLAAALRKAIDKVGRAPKLLVQVNTGAEPQKGGILPPDLPAFLERVRTDHGLTVEGLMAIPPMVEQAAPHFALIAKLADRHGLPLRSMGMSADFPEAVMLGATHVRVGTAIFGERPQASAA